ncbi:putative GNAT family N-acyltransferase [Fontibacillus solani]|uniref:Putative GNAT family N-acyltransferase n=1 Tax=Fontibacillus solani TaxID=1572857 RepID=A0A7W3SYJ4_9BACL|nr:GNAT family N-acetyltransferase [Fontibacillus solani]MBA9088621.1 putative GNAT family N-acyltransferase [Fontibacillus solani]
MTLIAHRDLDLSKNDTESICTFPQSAEELFYIGPRFIFPLTSDQIVNILENRFSPTVIVDINDNPIGYANLYDVNQEFLTCWLGNVIVSSTYRGKGISKYLVNVMMKKAVDEYKVKRMKLYCHNTNTRALLFYTKQGFKPCGSRIIENYENQKIVSIEMERELI